MIATPSSAPAKKAPTSPPAIDALLAAYYDRVPDPHNPAEQVSFGTSGHRGSSLTSSFNEAHILAVTQAVCDYRASQGISGPLFMGKDTHALSAPALETALEVLAAAGVTVRIQANDLPTPTPVISNAILAHNAKGQGGVADGIVVTPSHNPPEDGGFKYNESHGGPAGTAVTSWVQTRANEYLRQGNRGVKRLAKARGAACVEEIDFIMPYVHALEQTVNMRAIAASGLRLGADPLGGASLPYWEPIAELYKLNLKLVNNTLDPAFRFMPKDHDGKIRMDCSSPQAMAGLIKHAGEYDIAFGNDPDADRHGIVTPAGLMNPNHYLCAAVFYLLQHRPHWPGTAAVGKTCVTSSMMNRVCAALERDMYETPVGFKWFVQGLLSGDLLFGGEESAGASFLRLDGRPWSTDKDGLIMNLLAAEITATLDRNPATLYSELTQRFGEPFYARIDAPASAEQKKAFTNLQPESVTRKDLAGSSITNVFTLAPGNKEAIGGIKVESADGWFAARPSGTEDIYKIYAESFVSKEHLAGIQQDAKAIVGHIFTAHEGNN